LRSARLRLGVRWRFVAPVAAAALGVLSYLAIARHSASRAPALEQQAQEFVALALSLAEEHPQEVDAYFGPQALAARGKSRVPAMQTLLRRAQMLHAELQVRAGDASARRANLLRQIGSFSGLLEVMQSPEKYSFDEEARLIYGMQPVVVDREASNRNLQMLDTLLPGAGSLAQRVDSFRNQFVVAPNRQKAVFERALSECRARTMARWNLPADEELRVEWTHDVDAAWHRYQGRHHSTLQLNPAAVSYVDSAVDVACHEGYPGHHAQFVVMDVDAGADGLAVENTLVLLRSPISMLREGAAEYGVDLAFPPDERLTFERDVLFPLAGLDPLQAEKYVTVHRLIRELSSSAVPILRDYRDKRLSSEIAGRALQSTALLSSPQSLLRFVDELGPYVLGYTAAHDEVRTYVEARSRQTREDRWTVLRRVLTPAE
jgi:hypothetical protein